jgi:hypothetical protein
MDRLVRLVNLAWLIERISGPFDRRAKQGADGSGMSGAFAVTRVEASDGTHRTLLISRY